MSRDISYSAVSFTFGVCHLQKKLGSTDSDPVLPVLLTCPAPLLRYLAEEAGPCVCHTQTAPWHRDDRQMT